MNTPPEEPNPYEPPRVSVHRRGEKRRVALFALGVFLVPVAAIIGGYISCGAIVAAAMMVPEDNFLAVMLAALFGFLVGAIAAGWGVIYLLRKWMDR
jgi:hypothetical protein